MTDEEKGLVVKYNLKISNGEISYTGSLNNEKDDDTGFTNK